MNQVQTVHTTRAPRAVGPYSQAVRCRGLLWLSGQIGLDPESGRIAGEDLESQARQLMRNLTAVLRAAGADLRDILKVTIYLTDMADFGELNALYEAWLCGHRPARATVAVSALPLGARVEMDLVARDPNAE